MIALYFAILLSPRVRITRVRAEVGPPTHEMFVATRASYYRFARFTHDSATEPGEIVTVLCVQSGIPCPPDAPYIGSV